MPPRNALLGALRLWKMNRKRVLLGAMPARYSSEPEEQSEDKLVLQQAKGKIQPCHSNIRTTGLRNTALSVHVNETHKKKDGTLQRWSLVQLAPENKTGDKTEGQRLSVCNSRHLSNAFCGLLSGIQEVGVTHARLPRRVTSSSGTENQHQKHGAVPDD
jgi:hypothetical protein